MRIALYQFNPTVGDLSGNTDKLINAINESTNKGCDLFVTSELSITGYCPDDLLLRESFLKDSFHQLNRLLNFKKINLLIGCPYRISTKTYNSVFYISNGIISERYDKISLPNYGVFDELRYFDKGNTYKIIIFNNIKIGILICEDIWTSDHVMQLKNLGANLICVLNASPFRKDILDKRIQKVKQNIMISNIPIVYVNQIGGQDDIVYDGNSFVIDSKLEVKILMPAFEESLTFIDVTTSNNALNFISNNPPLTYNSLEYLYKALTLSLKDYIQKNGFKGVIIGLSGGIDSALTLAIANNALGKDNVITVMMPSKYTSKMSIDDAFLMSSNLGVKHHSINIDTVFTEYKNLLSDIFVNLKEDTTEENLQARIRGALLMAISNKLGYLVLTTGNKSEIATGYCTLYGDMVGGFCLLKDVYKTDVYKLSCWINSVKEVIPNRIITRAPTAELNFNQTDQDVLPEYSILDKILSYLLEDGLSSQDLLALGYPDDVITKVIRLLNLSEYKRKQSVIGPKVSNSSFTKEWRYPITNKYLF